MGIGFSILLIAAGAILAFAININDSTYSGVTIQWDTVGVILMIVGVIGLIWALWVVSAARRRNVVEVDRVPRDRITS
jgi:hypothetical protein